LLTQRSTLVAHRSTTTLCDESRQAFQPIIALYCLSGPLHITDTKAGALAGQAESCSPAKSFEEPARENKILISHFIIRSGSGSYTNRTREWQCSLATFPVADSQISTPRLTTLPRNIIALPILPPQTSRGLVPDFHHSQLGWAEVLLLGRGCPTRRQWDAFSTKNRALRKKLRLFNAKPFNVVE
jgi:hypothetical protein